MTYDFLSALAAFAFVTSITPGPNNLMLMTSGANFGFRRTIPHMLGVGLGFVFMVVLVGAGLVGVFEAYPVSYTILKAVSVVYLVYLAWKIAISSAPGEATRAAKPMTFLQAALFQWVNPKAWAMALTAVTVYAPSQSIAAIGLVAIVFGLVNLPSVGSWTILGQEMRRFLNNTSRLRTFNLIMAILLIASLFPILL
ncbi:MAG: LysE family translocator [Rhizobiales bacterium]|nr:LysE family translocator [Hyphomicrobiales bacterium]